MSEQPYRQPSPIAENILTPNQALKNLAQVGIYKPELLFIIKLSASTSRGEVIDAISRLEAMKHNVKMIRRETRKDTDPDLNASIDWFMKATIDDVSAACFEPRLTRSEEEAVGDRSEHGTPVPFLVTALAASTALGFFLEHFLRW